MKPSFFATIRVMCTLTAVLSVGNAHGEFGYPILPDFTPGLNPSLIFNTNLRLYNRITQERLHGIDSRRRTRHLSPRGPRSSLSTGRDFATTQGIRQLVASYPPENQPRMAAQFKQLIAAFNDTMPRTYGIPRNNLASAYAAVLAGSYCAYTSRPFPDHAVKPLYRQLEQIMLSKPAIHQASTDDKNTLYQVWVGLGMFMLMGQAELAKHPNPAQQAQLQKIGGDSLRALLGVEPDRVRFTASGLKLL